MTIRKLLVAASAAAVLGIAGMGAADAAPWHHDRHGHHGPAHVEHDRYWHQGYHGYVARDRIYAALRAHRYTRWVGTPYFYHGRYVVRAYNRFGRLVFVEVNPYTGGFIGEVRF